MTAVAIALTEIDDPMPRNTSESFQLAYRDQIEQHIEAAATANAMTERFAALLQGVMRLVDRKSMMSHADQCVVREAEAALVEGGFVVDPQAKYQKAYEEWEARNAETEA